MNPVGVYVGIMSSALPFRIVQTAWQDSASDSFRNSGGIVLIVILIILIVLFGFGGYRMGPGIGYYGGGALSLILLIILILLLLKVF